MKEAICTECGVLRGIVARGYCAACYGRLRYNGAIKTRPHAPRFSALEHLETVKANTTGGCWLWPGHIDINLGYGRVSVDSRTQLAHIWVYQQLVGPIPPKYEIDHLCHNWDLSCPGGNKCLHRGCVNPAHLEAVSKTVNNLRRRSGERRNTCRAGHERNEKNTQTLVKDGKTIHRCRRCHKRRNDAWKARQCAS